MNTEFRKESDVMIVGGGTAGLSAAIYARRAGRSVVLFESSMFGGQIVITPEVENYPGIKHISGSAFAMELYGQASGFGTVFVMENVISAKKVDDYFIVETRKGLYRSKALIIATGLKRRTLGLDKEKEFVGRGISYCATCDGMFFKGKDVAVAGGGNTAVEDARYLSEICNKVYVIHRRREFRADPYEVDKLRNMENTEFILDSNVTKISGNDRLDGIEVENKNDRSVRNISVSALFIAAGQIPDNDAFRDIADIDDSGYIVAGEDCRTGMDGLFAAGDCRTKEVRQLTTAASDGAIAGLAAAKYAEAVI